MTTLRAMATFSGSQRLPFYWGLTVLQFRASFVTGLKWLSRSPILIYPDLNYHPSVFTFILLSLWGLLKCGNGLHLIGLEKLSELNIPFCQKMSLSDQLLLCQNKSIQQKESNSKLSSITIWDKKRQKAWFLIFRKVYLDENLNGELVVLVDVGSPLLAESGIDHIAKVNCQTVSLIGINKKKKVLISSCWSVNSLMM
jgi:hypothetical protein